VFVLPALFAVAGRRFCQPHMRRKGLSRRAKDTDPALEKPAPLWKRMLRGIRKNGVGYTFAYGFVSNVNYCALLAVSWALFVKTRHANPAALSPDLPLFANVLSVFLRPARINPNFLVYYGAISLSLGSILRPLRIAVAAALVPSAQKFFGFLQNQLRCPRPLTWVVALASMTCFSFAIFPMLTFLCCAALGVPVAY